MRKLTDPEILAAQKILQKYLAVPPVTEIERQAHYVANRLREPVPCPLCSQPCPPYLAHVAWQMADQPLTRDMVLDQLTGHTPDDDHTCPHCGAGLLHILTIQGQQLWSIRP